MSRASVAECLVETAVMAEIKRDEKKQLLWL